MCVHAHVFAANVYPLQRWFFLGGVNALSVAMGFSGPMLLNGLLTYFQVRGACYASHRTVTLVLCFHLPYAPLFP